uniref:Uncharacterized protein n=1 Tax=Mycena chlorophos TaxID=658473 RepID=A0ABQ0L3C1_MYCCL|nr:predicted protein [Mycena chlorophos]
MKEVRYIKDCLRHAVITSRVADSPQLRTAVRSLLDILITGEVAAQDALLERIHALHNDAVPLIAGFHAHWAPKIAATPTLPLAAVDHFRDPSWPKSGQKTILEQSRLNHALLPEDDDDDDWEDEDLDEAETSSDSGASDVSHPAVASPDHGGDWNMDEDDEDCIEGVEACNEQDLSFESGDQVAIGSGSDGDAASMCSGQEEDYFPSPAPPISDVLGTRSRSMRKQVELRLDNQQEPISLAADTVLRTYTTGHLGPDFPTFAMAVAAVQIEHQKIAEDPVMKSVKTLRARSNTFTPTYTRRAIAVLLNILKDPAFDFVANNAQTTAIDLSSRVAQLRNEIPFYLASSAVHEHPTGFVIAGWELFTAVARDFHSLRDELESKLKLPHLREQARMEDLQHVKDVLAEILHVDSILDFAMPLFEHSCGGSNVLFHEEVLDSSVGARSSHNQRSDTLYSGWS